MAGCSPRPCDHHCARVCRQFVCTCDYRPGYSGDPDHQRVCCLWEFVYKPECIQYAYTNQDAEKDTLTRYFGVERSLRDPHDPIRFTGLNHVLPWLHTDLSSLDVNYSNHLKEREIMAASRYKGPRQYYQHRSIRPRNKPNEESAIEDQGMSDQDERNARKGVQGGRISIQGLRCGQMPFLD